jgi:serine/threonine protein phosphatase PrpC
LVINFDAHLDVRPLDKGLTSGTPFFRLLEKYGDKIDFVEIGAQYQCNSQSHVSWCLDRNARILFWEDIQYSGESFLILVSRFLEAELTRRRPCFLSVDIDGFSSSYAMGGSDRGEEAAIFAKNEIERGIASLGEQSSPEMLAHSLSNIIIETNKKMHVCTATKEDGTHRGVEDMGSTVSLLKVWRGKNGEKKLVVANVGDSRIYRLREGRLEQLTEDDGIPNAILADKEMTKNLSETSRQKLKDLFDTFETEDDLKKLSQEERNVFDLMFKFRKSVSQALGAAEVVPRTYIYDIEPGDEYIGTSDGIHDPLSNKRIERSLKNNPERSMVQKAKDLIADVKKANNEGVKRKKYDDKVVVGIRFEDDMMELGGDLLEIVGDDGLDGDEIEVTSDMILGDNDSRVPSKSSPPPFNNVGTKKAA